MDHEVIQVTAIKTLVDLLLIYGLQVFDISQQQSLAQPVSTASEDNDEDLFMPSPGSSQPPAIAGTQSTAVSDAVGSSVLRLLIEHMDSEVCVTYFAIICRAVVTISAQCKTNS